MKAGFRGGDKAQSQLDFIIAVTVFFTFLTAIVLVPQSPLFIGGLGTGELITEAEQTNTHIINELQEDQGEISNENVIELLNSNNPNEYTPIDGLNVNITLEFIDQRPEDIENRGEPPSMFNSPKETVGDVPPPAGTGVAKQNIIIDGKMVQLRVEVWL